MTKQDTRGTAGAAAIIRDARERGRTALTEREGLALLAEFGVRVPQSRLVSDASALAAAVADLTFPLVLKVESHAIVHKSDVGGVRLGCRTLADVEEAFAGILESVRQHRPDADVAGVLLEEQVEGIAECFIGCHADPEFGPVIGFGLGGIFVEVIEDLAWRAAPFDAREARRMIEETHAVTVLSGFRGRPRGDFAALAETLANVSTMVWELRDDVAELDVNPLLVGPEGSGVVAVDCFAGLRAVE